MRPLREAGIEARCFDGGATTLFENEYHGTDLGERTQTVHAVAASFKIKELDRITSGIVHLGPLTAEEMSAGFICAAASCGDWVVLDGQGLVRKIERHRVHVIDRPDLSRALSCIDILKTDAEEARALSNESDMETAARTLAALGPREVIVSCGAAGALIYASDRIERIEAVKPNAIVDPTGCGDSFAAGYAFGRAHNLDVSAAGRFAAALAALNLETKGPFAGTLEDVWARSGIRST